MEITKGKIQKAKKVVIYGPEGIGKSTFAARFPGAVFIDTEGSTNDMDVARLPRPTSWNMLFDEIEYIKTHTDECRTLVIDTVDWAELLCVEHICAVHNKKGIEDFGYGNGYVYTKEEFGRFLNKLSDLIEVGINVVLTAHLMYPNLVSEEELMEAVYQRGFFPKGTPFQNLPQKFVDGCLIGAWPQVLDVIKTMRSHYDIPFDK